MAMPIMVPVSVKPMASKKHGVVGRGATTRGTRERMVIYEGSSGPRELLEAIVIQSQAALKSLEGMKSTTDQDDEEMTEEQKRMTRDDKGKGKELEPFPSPENLKLFQFWYATSELFTRLSLIACFCVANVSSRRLRQSTAHYARPKGMHLLSACTLLYPRSLPHLQPEQSTCRLEIRTKRRARCT
jgi:hypothetical protein